MADTLKAKEQLAAIVDLFTSGDLVKTAAIVVIPQDAAAPSARWSLSNRIIQAIHGTGDARGIKQWNNVGRSVKAGSKAFCILGPSIIKDKADPLVTHLVGFHGIPVFRVEDTKGDALPSMEPVSPPVLKEVAVAFGLSVRYTAFSAKHYGYYSAGKREIVLCTHEQEVFFHELGHAAHERVTGTLKGGQDSKQEIVAEMTACVLARIYGIQAHEDKMQQYVRHYAEGKDLGRVLMGLLSDIQKTVDLIITTAGKLAQPVAV
jgi:hypothetical protein